MYSNNLAIIPSGYTKNDSNLTIDLQIRINSVTGKTTDHGDSKSISKDDVISNKKQNPGPLSGTTDNSEDANEVDADMFLNVQLKTSQELSQDISILNENTKSMDLSEKPGLCNHDVRNYNAKKVQHEDSSWDHCDFSYGN